MKLKFSPYGNLTADGAGINFGTLADICDCLGIEHKLIEAPAEMRKDNWQLAADYEKSANKREAFRLMLNHKAQFEPIIVEMETRLSEERGNPYDVVISWEV